MQVLGKTEHPVEQLQIHRATGTTAIATINALGLIEFGASVSRIVSKQKVILLDAIRTDRTCVPAFYDPTIRLFHVALPSRGCELTGVAVASAVSTDKLPEAGCGFWWDHGNLLNSGEGHCLRQPAKKAKVLF